ncbi:MAG: MFS transporter [Oligoflexales bacterium]|nr:MFS transporter [Oligoflexales bacterium]
MEKQADKQTSENVVVFLLAGFLFFHVCEFMVVMPLGPQLMRNLVLDSAQFSYLVSSYNFTAAASALFGLVWMDRFDRKRSLLLVNLLFALGTFACSISSTYSELLTARSFTGAFGGIISAISMAIIADVVPMVRRGFAMGKMMSGFSLAAIAGVPLGLILAQNFSWQTPFLAVSLGSALLSLFALFVLPPVRSHLNSNTERLNVMDFWRVLARKEHLKAFLFMVFLMMGQFTVIPFISPYLVSNMGMSESQLPVVYLLGGGLTVVGNPLIGKLADRYNKQLVFRLCSTLAIVPILAITHLGVVSLAVSLLVTSLFFIFISGRMSPAMALISDVPEDLQRGRFLSCVTAVQQGSAGLASWLAGSIIKVEADGSLLHYPSVGYIALGFCLMAILWVSQLKKVEAKPSF